MKKTTFEEYLETICFEANPSVLDDDMPDFFDSWLGSQDVEDMIRHCNNFLTSKIHQAIADERERVVEEIKGKTDRLIEYRGDTDGEWVLKQSITSILTSLDTNPTSV